MPYVSEKKLGPPTLGVFVPCGPRIDETSRKRAFNIRNDDFKFIGQKASDA